MNTTNDPIADMLTRVRNALLARHREVLVPVSKIKLEIARILQEEGRKQLGIGWGNAEKPLCQGLSFKQLTALDFSQMDLSEFVEDFREKISEEALSKKLKTSLHGFSEKVSLEDAQQKTNNLLSPDIKKVEEAKE